jgi:hypothetical protein
MSNKFFQNIKCNHFPCHKYVDKRIFNCLFCFCPLYFLPNCEGNYKIKSGIKDCSKCTIPHQKDKYNFIIKKLVENLKYKKINICNKKNIIEKLKNFMKGGNK